MTADEQPVVRVVKGDPTPEELAALTAVLAAKLAAKLATAAAAEPGTARASDWASYWRTVGHPLQHGPGRWRASGFPR